MQENEFEKKVRGLMDDLEITPSAPVWNYVEKRIPKSNRRRRFFAFFLLLAGFTVCGYFFYHRFSAGTINNTAVTTVKETATRKSGKDNLTNNNIIPVDTSTIAITATADVPIKAFSEDTKQLLSIKPVTNSLQATNEYGKQINIANATIAQAESGNILTTDEPLTSSQQPINTYEDTSINSIKDNEVIVNQDSIYTIVVQQPDTTTTALVTNDTIIKAKETRKKTDNVSKKLQWGVSGFYGRSDVVENISLITADKSYSWDGNLNAGPGGGNYSSSDSLRYANQSKYIKAKSAYSFGINIRKPLSARSNIVTGIEFMHMNTQIQTGLPKDSAAVFYYNNSQTATRLDNFYRPGLGSSQVNTYTIIQVPVLFNYRLSKNNKLPLNVDAGLSVARIIASDALVYDSYNFAYYENKDLLRETQVHLLAGFNASFRLGNNSSLQLGPQFQYGLTGLVKNNSSTQHFFTWGLQARYFIKK